MLAEQEALAPACSVKRKLVFFWIGGREPALPIVQQLISYLLTPVFTHTLKKEYTFL